jgi:hypothetical protein
MFQPMRPHGGADDRCDVRGRSVRVQFMPDAFDRVASLAFVSTAQRAPAAAHARRLHAAPPLAEIHLFQRMSIMLGCRSAVRRFSASVTTVALLAGCAATPMGPTVQVMPGPGKTFDAFQADNAACKGFAAQQVQGQAEAANQRAVGAALLTTALGAGVGAAGGALGGNAGAGAAVGSAVGAGAGTAIGATGNASDQQAIQAQYDTAFSQCMYARGEQVPGFAPPAPVVAAAPVAAPDPMIRATQHELIRLGYLQGSADGYSGPKTRRAISGFEQANGLPADGVASARLLARLQATASSPTATAAAPTNWVAPIGSPAAIPASAPAPSGWVAPTRSP